jgi:hypothetical protein
MYLVFLGFKITLWAMAFLVFLAGVIYSCMPRSNRKALCRFVMTIVISGSILYASRFLGH